MSRRIDFQFRSKVRIAPSGRLAKLSGVPETIEADVLEIDGSLPPAPREPEREAAWNGMKTRVLRLDRRWWPLWVILGVATFALVAAAGVVFALLVTAVRLIGIGLRFFTGTQPARSISSLSKSLR